MDWEHARYLLVEQQIRPWDVLDQKVLDRVLTVKREDFVPADKKALAFVDSELPIGHEATMLAPKVEARFLQDVEVQPTDKVLIAGAGTGYLMALAAGLASQVYGVEIEPELASQAEANLARAGVRNARVVVGDAVRGFAEQAPFDVIIVTGSFESVPASLKEQLAVGGRLIAIVGQLPIMSATLVRRVDHNAYSEEKLFEYNLPRMKNAPAVSAFRF
ncbi:protein-L-isoaspartate O-methyltransferase family protein [Silvimonas iriomotensis]|uniref:Protein-L-isoaspartate O-methyltransferase n=1 Tax=Silvimonas iriomotensis TaxID=449662 RepID=A0ABQ2PE37_9NEIS|nr:protein-L-isoaspartate O-methyltransferase [Silvimonas iriomotensis]GGP23651.1 protein-L-isoaspartate O-methyltransferase [Silvimonas iriomotensis]